MAWGWAAYSQHQQHKMLEKSFQRFQKFRHSTWQSYWLNPFNQTDRQSLSKWVVTHYCCNDHHNGMCRGLEQESGRDEEERVLEWIKMDSWEIPSAVGDYRVTKQWVGLQKSNSTVCSATMCLILEEQAKHVTRFHSCPYCTAHGRKVCGFESFTREMSRDWPLTLFCLIINSH